MRLLVALAGTVMILVSVVVAIGTRASRVSRRVSQWANQITMWLSTVALVPKLKVPSMRICPSVYEQLASATCFELEPLSLPPPARAAADYLLLSDGRLSARRVYLRQDSNFSLLHVQSIDRCWNTVWPDGLKLPDSYYEWLGFLSSFEINWSDIFIPAACWDSGFRLQLWIRGIGPLLFMAWICVFSWIGRVTFQYLNRVEGDRIRWMRCLLDTLPTLLFIAFVLVTGTSTSIFAVWTCEQHDLDSISIPPVKASFLSEDLSLRCDGPDDEYSGIVTLAYVFVALWPIGTPLLFFLVLFNSREMLVQGRMTPLVRSTSFLRMPSRFELECVGFKSVLIRTRP